MLDLVFHLFFIGLLACLTFVVIKIHAQHVPMSFSIFENASELLAIGALFIYLSLVLLSLKLDIFCMKIRHFFRVLFLKIQLFLLYRKHLFLNWKKQFTNPAILDCRVKLSNEINEFFDDGQLNTPVGSDRLTDERLG